MTAEDLLAPGDTEGTIVASDGTRLFVRSRNGDHPASATRVLFCDGILCDGFIWKYLWEGLAARHPLSHFHYRGHGRSAAPADVERIGIDAHADDLARVREAVGDPPVVIVGHSMGTQVALEHYHQRPEGVRALVLMCGSFGRVTATVRGMPILDLVLPKLIDAVTRAPDVARAVWSHIPPEATLKLAYRTGDLLKEKLPPEDMLPYMRHMTHMDLAIFLWMLRAAGDHSAWDYLPTVHVPTLILAAERDTFTPAYLAREMARVMPNARLVELAGASHVAPLDHPGVVRETIEEFLEAHGIS